MYRYLEEKYLRQREEAVKALRSDCVWCGQEIPWKLLWLEQNEQGEGTESRWAGGVPGNVRPDRPL